MNEHSGNQIAQWLATNQLDAIHTKEPSLGDVFMKLTGSELS